MIEVRSEPFDPSASLAEFAADAGEGAIVSFVGVVRGEEGLRRLLIHHYPGFTDYELNRIAAGVASRFSLSAVAVLHRVGTLEPGEPIVFAATSAPHRRPAIDGLDALMDYLKNDAPFWKCEELSSGEIRWVEPSFEDVRRRQALGS